MSSYDLPGGSKIGAGYMAHRLAQAMAGRGHEVTMFSPCVRSEDAVYKHVQLPMNGSLRTFRWSFRLTRLDMSRFDLIHAHGGNNLRFRGNSPPVVRTLYGSGFSECLNIRGAKERTRMFCLGLMEGVGAVTATVAVACSHNTRQFFPWVHRVIPCGVDLRLFHPGLKEDRPTILFVGTYERRKRGRLLLEAFSEEVLPRVPGARLWMVCSDAPPTEGVEVLGRVSDEELADYYRRAWVFCLPSTYEGFGVPYIEAMASGTAVVATANAGAMEVLDQGRYGAISTSACLGENLGRLLEDPQLRQEFADLALDNVRKYDWGVVADAYEAVYRQVSSHGHPGLGQEIERQFPSMRIKALLKRVKALLKRITPSILWEQAHRVRAWSQSERVTRFVARATHGTVAGGPFTGLLLPAEGSWGSLSPLLIGSYETELHEIIERVVASEPSVVVNVGCAEGYYAIGLAKRLPSATVYAFDIDPTAQRICSLTARLNDVEQRVHVRGECGVTDLEALTGAKCFLLLDCEGAERVLLNPELAPRLRDSEILVEMHDFLDPSIKSTILTRFAHSHSIHIVVSQPRDAADFPVLSGLAPRLQASALSEGRPTEPYPMEWAWLRPKTN